MTRPFLATDRVRFVGEPVAAVLTEEAYQGEDAAELVDVEYDPLAVVIDPLEAANDATVLFPDAGTNTARLRVRRGGRPELLRRLRGRRHPGHRQPAPGRGPPGDARRRALVGRRGRSRCSSRTRTPRAAATRSPGWLGLETEKVRVILPDVGGGFGAKIGSDPEFAIVGRLSQTFGRPVRWNESRSENMTGMVQGRAQRQTVTIGGTREGRVTHYRLDVVQDLGAYPRLGAFLPVFTRMMAPGTYDIENVDSRARPFVTNTTSVAAYRGAGRPEATAAIERAMDLFAAEIGMDAAEVRKRNVVDPTKFPFTTKGGAEYDSGEYARAIDRALDESGYAKLRAEQEARRERGDALQLGIGVSSFVEITGGGAYVEHASVEVHPDGTVTVLTGTSPHGQGHATAWAMLASEHLGIGLDKITVKHGDTDLVPKGDGTMGSRSLQTGGIAVHQAAGELVEVAKQRAADLLEASVDDLEVDKDHGAIIVRVCRTPPSRWPSWPRARSCRWTPGSTAGSRRSRSARTSPSRRRRGVRQAVIDKIVTVDDAGPVLNPLLAEGQRHGGIAQGIAQALLEEVVFDEEGKPLTATFADYGIPSAAELPELHLLDMATPTHLNPMGVKGIGEAGTIGSTPAAQSAVIDALSHLGVRHIDMPLTPLRVWEAINAASKGARK